LNQNQENRKFNGSGKSYINEGSYKKTYQQVNLGNDEIKLCINIIYSTLVPMFFSTPATFKHVFPVKFMAPRAISSRMVTYLSEVNLNTPHPTPCIYNRKGTWESNVPKPVQANH